VGGRWSSGRDGGSTPATTPSPGWVTGKPMASEVLHEGHPCNTSTGEWALPTTDDPSRWAPSCSPPLSLLSSVASVWRLLLVPFWSPAGDLSGPVPPSPHGPPSPAHVWFLSSQSAAQVEEGNGIYSKSPHQQQQVQHPATVINGGGKGFHSKWVPDRQHAVCHQPKLHRENTIVPSGCTYHGSCRRLHTGEEGTVTHAKCHTTGVYAWCSGEWHLPISMVDVSLTHSTLRAGIGRGGGYGR